MKCPLCNQEVGCLNNTYKGETCYECRKLRNLKIIPFKKELKSNGKNPDSNLNNFEGGKC